MSTNRTAGNRWDRFRSQPTGWGLFRTYLKCSTLALCVLTIVLGVCWHISEYDAELKTTFLSLFAILSGILLAGGILHFPWSDRWVKSGGCQPDVSVAHFRKR
jgi:hypothetical protein